MLKRPSPLDDDEEILRQQEEFFKQRSEKKIIPAAKVIKSNNKNELDSTSIKDEKMDTDPPCDHKEHVENLIFNTFETFPKNLDQMRNQMQITEKNDERKKINSLKFTKTGFPKAARRDPSVQPLSGSLFANQHCKKVNKDKITLELKEKCAHGKMTKISKPMDLFSFVTTAQRSTILSASDRQQIHNDNLKTLSAMSEEEILAEKEKLMTSLDPALIQFLKSQKNSQTQQNQTETRNRTIQEQNNAGDDLVVDQLEATKELLNLPAASGWLNFNKFEANKLAWMKDISIPDLKNSEGFEARFDFGGYLQPYCVAQIDEKNRHLYHHGDEPERPGYNLQELLLLCRSNVVQQRIVALNTLANILELEQTGIYDKVIDLPIEQVFFVLRVALDDNAPSVLTAAIKAIRNLIYFQLDETCLYNMMSFAIGFVQPILAVDHVSEDDYRVNDQQLVETNLVRCLTRTEILIRIRYIIDTVKPPVETIVYCLEVLVRLARDSDFIVEQILNCDGLLEKLIKYFAPARKDIRIDSSYINPLPQMIKLLRILSCRSYDIATSLFHQYNVLDIVLSYLYDDNFSQNAFGMRLQIESMHYWSVLVHYGLGLECVNQHVHLLERILDYHYRTTDNIQSTTLIRQSHVSALLMLLSRIAERGFCACVDLTAKCFQKWISQFSRAETFKCGHSQITAAVLYLGKAYKQKRTIYDVQCLIQFIASNSFNLATGNIINGSVLLNNYETHKTSANLKTLEAATWYSMDHIVPVMQTNSCIPLLHALSECISNEESLKVKEQFLKHPNVTKYIEALSSAKHYFNVGNWFTRCESFLIMNILKIAKSIEDRLDPACYYSIAVKCLCVFSCEQKLDMHFILDKIVFDSRFYSVDVAMARASITEENSQLNEVWRHLDDIKDVYAKVLGITTNIVKYETSLCLDMSIGNVIPIDWIYMPLIQLYANQQKRSNKTPIDEQEDCKIILNCLRWVLLYETYFSNLAASINPTEKYVRLSCLFLGSDDLFLYPELEGLLKSIFWFIVQNESKIDFEQEISGLSNFKDFYVQLLEQYQAVSYGNKTFGNIVLFPLAKRHDIKYRKTLWSEYMGVVEAFTLNKEEVWLDSNTLMYPVDTDVSLCKSYFRALSTHSVPKNTILYEIASETLTRQNKMMNNKK